MENRMQTSLISLRRILRATEFNARSLAHATGLSVAQLVVLELVASEDRVLPTAIAKGAGVGHATATSLIDKLQRRGLVMRTRGKRDRRHVWVSITDEGRDLLSRAPNPLQRTYSEQFEKLPDWEQAMIVATLEKVASLLNAGAIDASPLLHVGAVDPKENVTEETASQSAR
jgi:DNA-binding MarR family transcriptional regulator